MVSLPAGLAYAVKDGVVTVTTVSGAQGKLMTRTYAVADLVGASKKDGMVATAVL